MMQRFLKITREEKGSLMIESMVATTLVVIGILGIMSLLSRSANLSHYASHSFQATYLAAEGIEVVKNILDTDISRNMQWGTSMQGAASPLCVYYNTVTNLDLASCAGGEGIAYAPSAGLFLGPNSGALFKREVTVTETGGVYDVISTVSWKEGSEQKSVVLEDTFYPWRTQ